jgi:hypothetical protein
MHWLGPLLGSELSLVELESRDLSPRYALQAFGFTWLVRFCGDLPWPFRDGWVTVILFTSLLRRAFHFVTECTKARLERPRDRLEHLWRTLERKLVRGTCHLNGINNPCLRVVQGMSARGAWHGNAWCKACQRVVHGMSARGAWHEHVWCRDE